MIGSSAWEGSSRGPPVPREGLRRATADMWLVATLQAAGRRAAARRKEESCSYQRRLLTSSSAPVCTV